MYQADSWFLVLFELVLVGTALYNSFKLTRWWNIINGGVRVQVNGATRVPSVASYYSLNTEGSVVRKRSMPTNFEPMGDAADFAMEPEEVQS